MFPLHAEQAESSRPVVPQTSVPSCLVGVSRGSRIWTMSASPKIPSTQLTIEGQLRCQHGEQGRQSRCAARRRGMRAASGSLGPMLGVLKACRCL